VNHSLTIQVHASCVEVAGTGVLLRAASGGGKSDLALRLIDAGARLVADDRTDLAAENGRLIATAPAPLAGRLEVRGVGILGVPSVARCVVGLAVDLVPQPDVERLPSRRECTYLGIGVPLIALAPFEASAAAKLRLAAREVANGRPFAA
jgi:serine kinase of HPr protein (carbohydrate metabolism regulator)